MFQTLAGAAGLAGISIGFVLLIFRDIIKKNVFPKLSAEHAYGILRLIIQLTFAVGILGIGAWVVDRSHMFDFSRDYEISASQTQTPKPESESAPPQKLLDARSEAEFRKRTYAIIAKTMDIPPSTIRPQTRLYNQSFELRYLVLQLETSFGIDISDAESHSFRTAEDVVKCVEQEAASQRQSP